MAIIQPRFEISEEAVAGILKGELIRHGGVVYHKTGGIFEHLKDITNSGPKEEANSLQVLEFMKKNKVVIAIGLGVVVVAGGMVILLADKAQKKKRKNNPKIPKSVENYNASLCAYLESIHNGNLNIEIIDSLISDLEKIKEDYSSNKISIDFSTKQLDTLVGLVVEYTQKLAEVNSVSINSFIEPDSISSTNKIIDLQQYLQVQKQIFEKLS